MIVGEEIRFRLKNSPMGNWQEGVIAGVSFSTKQDCYVVLVLTYFPFPGAKRQADPAYRTLFFTDTEFKP